MISANTANSIATENAKKIVEGFFDKEEIIPILERRVLEASQKGSTNCTHYIWNSVELEWLDLIEYTSRDFICELENSGYHVILSKTVKDRDVSVAIDLYWGNSYKEFSALANNTIKHPEDGIMYISPGVSLRL